MDFVWIPLYNAMKTNLPLWANMIIYVAFFAVGIVCLVKFCDMFVDSSSVIAKKLKVSPMIIGLTIVAMGTSMPELSVSLGDAISKLQSGGNSTIAIGNVVGSNICNILLVLAMSVMFQPIVVKKTSMKQEMPILLGATAILTIFICLFTMVDVDGSAKLTWVGQPRIGRVEGAILLALFVGYMVFMLLMAKKNPQSVEEIKIEKNMSWGKAIGLCIVGLVGIILGGQFVVFGAQYMALDGAEALGWDMDLTTSLVAYTIVAIGTSLPELVTSVVAARKGENDIALGNVVGSNIFNALFILGVSALVNPLTQDNTAIVDAIVMLVVAVLLFILSIKGKLSKRHGIVMLALYLFYTVYLILRTALGWTF